MGQLPGIDVPENHECRGNSEVLKDTQRVLVSRVLNRFSSFLSPDRRFEMLRHFGWKDQRQRRYFTIRGRYITVSRKVLVIFKTLAMKLKTYKEQRKNKLMKSSFIYRKKLDPAKYFTSFPFSDWLKV